MPEWVWVTLAACLVLVAHALSRVAGLGEQDSARFARDSIEWHLLGTVSIDAYRLRASPLYMHFIKLALDHHLPVRRLPALMNWFSIAMSSVCLAALYYLFQRFVRWQVAALACALCALTPGFWVCSIYGIPTLPGLAFWVLAALAFAHAGAADAWLSRRFLGWLATSFLCAVLALTLKADVVLCSGIFVALAWKRPGRRLRLLASSALVIGGALGCLLLYAGRLGALYATPGGSAPSQSALEFSTSWSEQFPFRLDNLLNVGNAATITHSSGTLLFAVILLALVAGLIAGGERRELSVATALAALPTILFWGFKSGNSARHNVPALPMLVLCATALLFVIAGGPRRACLLALSLLLLACLDTSGGGSVTPPANLWVATHQIREFSDPIHERVRAFLRQPGSKKALIDGHLSAYDEFEAFAFGADPHYDIASSEVTVAPGYRVRLVYATNQNMARARARELRGEGWQVFSLSFGL